MHDNQSLILQVHGDDEPKREGGDDWTCKSKEAIYTNSAKYQNLDRQLRTLGL